jgi:hypothetical protein
MATMGPSLKQLAKTGFGIGLGAFAAMMVYIALGLIFFVPGFILYKKAEKARETDSTGRIFSIILMGIGVIIMGGIGLSLLMDNIGDLF